ncbi:type II toxin-antitoxin system PemK/MazF family toxin [Lactococcus lactis]|uniref:type II toxin-antitoxin system PemK/MazF family toxin n=1 Tax=Lactococcus lactis TaxID=1358 RepID=UPI003F2248E5
MEVGQGILTKIKFKNGVVPKNPRPYLVVNVKSQNLIEIIDVSSTEGKEHKLLFPTNYSLSTFNPPFKKNSFVKLDSIRTVQLSELRYNLLHKGECLNDYDLKMIQNKLNNII